MKKGGAIGWTVLLSACLASIGAQAAAPPPPFNAAELQQVFKGDSIERLNLQVAGKQLKDDGNGVWWEKDYARAGGRYLRFHFDEIRSAGKPDFKLEVWEMPDSRRIATYDGAAFAADSTFTTDLLPAGDLRLKLVAPARPDGLSFRWAHATWRGGTSAFEPESPVAPYRLVGGLKPGTPQFTLARAAAVPLAMLHVGPLDVACSGVLVGKDLVATNHHCMVYSLKFQRTKGTTPAACDDVVVEFDFLERGVRGVATRCVAVALADAALDIAVLRIDPEKIKAAGQPRRPVVLRPESEQPPTRVIVVHHPVGLPAAIQTTCEITGTVQTELLHDCYTLRGSSGSPLLDEQLRLTGIHYRGPYPITWTLQQVEKDQADHGPRYNQARMLDAIRRLVAAPSNP